MKNTNYFLYLICITVTVGMISCRDDDGGRKDISFNEREFLIDFQEIGHGDELFCYVSDEDGNTLWDSSYSDNVSIKSLQVPLNQKIDITFGRSYVTNGFVNITTFHDVENYFSTTYNGGCFLRPSASDFRGKYFKVNGVSDSLEILQIGMQRPQERAYNEIKGCFSFRADPLIHTNLNSPLSAFLAVRHARTKDIRGVLIDHATMRDADTISISYSDFEELDEHIIKLDERGYWVFDMTAIVNGDVQVFQSGTGSVATTTGPRDQCLVYLPKDVKFEDLSIGIRNKVFSNSNHKFVYQGQSLPNSLQALRAELEDFGTTQNALKYKLNIQADINSSVLLYEGPALRRVVQLDAKEVDFSLPPIPLTILQNFPALSSSLDIVTSLEVEVYLLDSQNEIPAMNSTRILQDIYCIAQKNVLLRKQF